MQRFSIGIDVHRRSWAVTIISSGTVVFRGVLDARPETLLKLFPRHGIEPKTARIAYEVGPTGFCVSDAFAPLGYEVLAVSPNRIPCDPKRKIKTDARDSLELARLLEAGLLRGVRVPSLEERALRDLARTRYFLARRRASLLQSLKMKLVYLGIDYGERKYSRVFERWVMEQPMPEYCRVSIGHLFASMAALAREIRALEKEIQAALEGDPRYALYQTAPGIGPTGAAILLTEIGDLRRFAHPDFLASYLGLCPREHSSGEKIHRGAITHEGNTRARCILVEASWALIRKDPRMRLIYGRIAARRGGKKAIVAVARRLAHALWAMVRSGAPYQVNRAA